MSCVQIHCPTRQCVRRHGFLRPNPLSHTLKRLTFIFNYFASGGLQKGHDAYFWWYMEAKHRFRRNIITYFLQLLVTTICMIAFFIYGFPLLLVPPSEPIILYLDRIGTIDVLVGGVVASLLTVHVRQSDLFRYLARLSLLVGALVQNSHWN